MDKNQIIIRPIVTEKSTFLGQENKYVFEVSVMSNKVEIKKAFEKIYKLQPVKINIIRVKGKHVRYGKTTGQTKKWKKAIITLKEGEKIDLNSS